ncbi:hypothetical protein ACFL09_05620, partial [Planctomycetota bacterium]
MAALGVLGRRVFVVVAVAALCCGIVARDAAAIDWTDPGTDNWTDGTNWNPPGPPGPGDKANIFNGGTAYIAGNAGTIQRFELAGPSGATSGFLELRTGGSLATNNSGNTYVGARGTGRLTIEDGASLTIGPGSFYVGWHGAGSAHGHGTVIQNGGTVTMGKNIDLAQNDADTFGRYEIHGGSLSLTSTSAGYLQIGRMGTGEFVQTDGIVTISRTSDAVMVGAQQNATGTYTMSGGELRVPNGFMYVGQQQNAIGTFTQTDGTVTLSASDRDLIIGHGGGNTGTYHLSGGIGSSLSVNDDLLVGNSGTGTLNQNGGSVSVRDYLNLAENASGTGTYTLGGGTVTTRTIGVGVRGTGTFTQTSGTLTTAGSDSDLRIGREGSGVGTYHLVDGKLDVFDDIYVGFNGTGTLTQDAGEIDSKTLLVARYNNSKGDVVLNNADLTTRGSVLIGIEDEGSLTLHNGTVNVGDVYGVGWNGSGDGTVVHDDGIVNVPASGHKVYIGRQGVGHYTMNDGELNAPNAHMYVGGQENSGGPGDGTFIQNGGDVVVGQALRMATYRADTKARYEIHDGSLTIGQYLQVGRNGTATFIQTGGAVRVLRNNDALVMGASSGAKGTYIISGGTLEVPNHTTFVGVGGGQGMLDVRGSAADIDLLRYQQNNQSTLRSAIHNAGITRVDVASTATISTGAMVDVDIWGGVLFTPFPAFEFMRTATAGNISGAFTVTDPEPIWTVVQDGTVVQAVAVPTLAAASLGPNRWFEVVIGGGAGSVTDMMPVTGLHPGEDTWLAIDLVDIAGNDLSPA